MDVNVRGRNASLAKHFTKNRRSNWLENRCEVFRELNGKSGSVTNNRSNSPIAEGVGDFEN